MADVHSIQHPHDRVRRVPQLVLVDHHLPTQAKDLEVALEEEVEQGEKVLERCQTSLSTRRGYHGSVPSLSGRDP